MDSTGLSIAGNARSLILGPLWISIVGVVKLKKTATPNMAALNPSSRMLRMQAGDHVDTGIQVFVGGMIFLLANFCEPLCPGLFPKFWVGALGFPSGQRIDMPHS